MKITQILGLSGNPIHEPGEPSIVTSIGMLFQFIIMLISLWLPLQGYLVVHGYLGWNIQLITTWVFWAVILLFSLTMIMVIRHRLRYLANNWLNFLNLWIAYPLFWLFGNTYYSSYIWAMIVLILMLVPWLVMVSKILSTQRVWAIVIVFILYAIQGGFILAYIDQAIGNPWKGIWWAFQTLTTVGYGDTVPETYLGQVYAIIFMLGGLSLMAILSATITYLLLQKNTLKTERKTKAILRRLRHFKVLSEDLKEIKAKLELITKDKK